MTPAQESLAVRPRPGAEAGRALRVIVGYHVYSPRPACLPDRGQAAAPGTRTPGAAGSQAWPEVAILWSGVASACSSRAALCSCHQFAVQQGLEEAETYLGRSCATSHARSQATRHSRPPSLSAEPGSSRALPEAPSGARRGTQGLCLHAPEVECIGKGKAHKPYESGKVSVATNDSRMQGWPVRHPCEGNCPATPMMVIPGERPAGDGMPDRQHHHRVMPMPATAATCAAALPGLYRRPEAPASPRDQGAFNAARRANPSSATSRNIIAGPQPARTTAPEMPQRHPRPIGTIPTAPRLVQSSLAPIPGMPPPNPIIQST